MKNRKGIQDKKRRGPKERTKNTNIMRIASLK